MKNLDFPHDIPHSLKMFKYPDTNRNTDNTGQHNKHQPSEQFLDLQRTFLLQLFYFTWLSAW